MVSHAHERVAPDDLGGRVGSGPCSGIYEKPSVRVGYDSRDEALEESAHELADEGRGGSFDGPPRSAFLSYAPGATGRDQVWGE
jgi:hypothetical protein